MGGGGGEGRWDIVRPGFVVEKKSNVVAEEKLRRFPLNI